MSDALTDDLAAKLCEPGRVRECDELRELNNDLLRTNDQLSALLDSVALALKGKPPAHGMHSWNDLPELAQALVDSLLSQRIRPDSPRSNSQTSARTSAGSRRAGDHASEHTQSVQANARFRWISQP
jgi:hypothetical protein